MRHLVVGNSHIAALKLGWDQIAKKNRGTELVFAGVRGEQLNKLYIDGDILTARSPRARQMMAKLAGTEDPIDVTTFDKCWVVGCQMAVLPFARLYRNYRSESHPDPGKNCQILSDEAFGLAASTALTNASGIVFARDLATREVELGLIPQPMPSHAVFDIRPGWRDVSDVETQQTIASMFIDALGSAAEELGAFLALQPASTLHTPLTTKAHLARGLSGLIDNAHAENDIMHMNGDYGRQVIEEHLIS